CHESVCPICNCFYWWCAFGGTGSIKCQIRDLAEKSPFGLSCSILFQYPFCSYVHCCLFEEYPVSLRRQTNTAPYVVYRSIVQCGWGQSVLLYHPQIGHFYYDFFRAVRSVTFFCRCGALWVVKSTYRTRDVEKGFRRDFYDYRYCPNQF